MIEPSTGQILLPSSGVRVCPLLTREQLLASSLPSQGKVLDFNTPDSPNPFLSISMPTVEFAGHAFNWNLKGSVR
jgi:hypothetical protein